MASIKKIGGFSETVCLELGNYVYRLIDPRNGDTFYVGKGRNNRVFEHAKGELKFSDKLDDDEHDTGDDEASAKIGRIREIIRAGLEVVHIIHRHQIPDAAVFEVEAALMDAYPGLANAVTGHGSKDRGPMHAREIIYKYDLPEIDWEPEHKLVLININKFEQSENTDVYNQVRFSWRISRSRANQADYVLAVVRGVVVGAYEAERWMSATKKNFPEIILEEPKRNAFKGKRAPPKIWNLYCGEQGKRIAKKGLRHVQNPIRYWNID